MTKEQVIALAMAGYTRAEIDVMNGTPASGAKVQLSTTYGQMHGSPEYTDRNGDVGATAASTTPAPVPAPAPAPAPAPVPAPGPTPGQTDIPEWARAMADEVRNMRAAIQASSMRTTVIPTIPAQSTDDVLAQFINPAQFVQEVK